MRDRGFNRAIVVDATASDHTIPVLLHAADLGYDIVMANKRRLSADTEVWYKLMAARRRGQCIRHEATVGAGLPADIHLARLSASTPATRLSASTPVCREP